MSKKIILVLFGFVFLFSYNLVQADVIINEVQISGVNADDEFIEIYNSGDSDVDLTNWYINKKSSTGNESALVVKSRLENKTIPSSSYFLLARENGYVGSATPDVLWPSSYSLANNNSIILYRGDETDKDQTSWESIEEGKSIQRQSDGSWIVATPTPGAENQTSSGDEGDGGNNDNNGDDGTTGGSSSSKKEVETVQKPLVNKTNIVVKSPAFVGVPVEFTVNNTVSDKSCGKYFWNFGDGNSEEIGKMYPIPKKFTHIYYYGGEYIVTLECYKSYLSSEPETSDKITLKVVSADILISRVGDGKDFFVEISNNTSFEADISNWILLSNWKKFVFPKNSILKPKNKIIISSKITHFSLEDESTLKLLNSLGEVVFDYSSPIKPVKVLAKNYTQSKVSVSEPVSNTFNIADTGENNIGIKKMTTSNTGLNGLADNLSAEVIKSDANVKDNFKYGILGLFIFLGIGTSAAYFIRNRNRKSTLETNGNDFEIIDG